MNKDKQARQLAKLEEARQQMDEKFARIRQRILSGSTTPNDDQQRIINMALCLLNESGLNDLSLRKLAARLDLKAPALYWHFKNKGELIDYMAEAILKKEFQELQPRHEQESWQDWLVDTCSRLRRAMLSHRDGARVVAGAHLYPAITLMRLSETSMQSLVSAGIELQKANLIITTAVHFVFGNVIEEQASPTPEEIEQFNFNALETDYPLMTRSVRQSVEDAKKGYDEFEDALRLIIH